MCEGPHAYIPVANTVEARLIFSQYGQVLENVFNFHKATAWTTATMYQLAQGISDSWESNLSTYVADAATLESIVITDLSSQTGPQIVLPAGIQGGAIADGQPNNVTIAVSFKTNSRGRSYRGRAFHVGLKKSWQAGNAISQGNAEALRLAYETFFGDLTGAVSGTEHVVVSRCQNKEWLAVGVFTPVTAYQVEPNLDNQRRRLAGRGI